MSDVGAGVVAEKQILGLPRFIMVRGEAVCGCAHRFGSLVSTFWCDGYYEMFHQDGTPEEEYNLESRKVCPRCGKQWRYKFRRITPKDAREPIAKRIGKAV